MLEMTTMAWFVAGLAAGLLHASMLWRATHRLSARASVLGMLRLGVVATVLVVAAVSGAILEAAAGWAVGFVTLSTCLTVNRKERTVPSSRRAEGVDLPIHKPLTLSLSSEPGERTGPSISSSAARPNGHSRE